MLRASVIGNLGSDPELRYSQKGEQIVTVRVAVNQRKRVPNTEDQYQESTEWFRVRCTGWRAEQAQRLSKGQRVYVCGRLEIGHWQRQDGSAGVGYDIWADELHGMSAPRGEAPAASDGPSANGANRHVPVSSEPTDLEDLPF